MGSLDQQYPGVKMVPTAVRAANSQPIPSGADGWPALVGQPFPLFSHFKKRLSVTRRKRLRHCPTFARKLAILFHSTRHNGRSRRVRRTPSYFRTKDGVPVSPRGTLIRTQLEGSDLENTSDGLEVPAVA
jgi:hypothetical protein